MLGCNRYKRVCDLPEMHALKDRLFILYDLPFHLCVTEDYRPSLYLFVSFLVSSFLYRRSMVSDDVRFMVEALSQENAKKVDIRKGFNYYKS
jgi:hypothetical protein